MNPQLKKIVDSIWDIKDGILNKREEVKIKYQKQLELKSEVLKLGHRISEIEKHIKEEQELILTKISSMKKHR